jgi:hypothetical protein
LPRVNEDDLLSPERMTLRLQFRHEVRITIYKQHFHTGEAVVQVAAIKITENDLPEIELLFEIINPFMLKTPPR